MNPKIDSEISRYGDVSGYIGSRYAKPATQNHFDKIPNLPVSIPGGANNSTISRDRVETTNIQIDSENATQFNNELHYNNGTVQVDIDNAGIVITRAGKTLTINPTLLTQNMNIIEIDVCSAGVAKKMLIIGSVPY